MKAFSAVFVSLKFNVLMKKLLLTTAFVLLALGASPQGLKSLIPASVLAGETVTGLKGGHNVGNLDLGKARKSAAARAAAKAPEGESRMFMLLDYEPVSGFTEEDGAEIAFPRIRKQELVFADDGKVYIPNMMLTSALGEGWLEGVFDGDGNIVIEPGQTVATYSDPELGMSNDFILSTVDYSTDGYQPGNEPITLYFEDDGYYLPEGQFLGLFRVDEYPFLPMPIYTLQTYCSDLAYGDVSALGEPVEYDYTCDELTGEAATGLTGTVEMYSEEDMNISTSLLPACPDAMMMFIGYAGKEDIMAYCTTVADDDALFMGYTAVGGGAYQTASFINFFYNGADGSYDCEDGFTLGDFFINPLNGTSGFSCMYGNMSLVPSGTAGVGSVGAAGGRSVVATEYYDLSGRRTGKAAKGVGIVVEKYADGTSRAVKVVR